MEPFVIREKDLIKTLFTGILMAVLVFTALFVMFPSGLDNLIENAFRNMKNFMVFLFFIFVVFILPICRLIIHIVRSRKAERVFLKVDEKGLYLNANYPCFLRWTQIDRIEICRRPKGAMHPSWSLDVHSKRKKDPVISFYLDEYSVSTSDLVNAINTFSGRPDMVKIQKWYE